jgi:hypothetical protein
VVQVSARYLQAYVGEIGTMFPSNYRHMNQLRKQPQTSSMVQSLLVRDSGQSVRVHRRFEGNGGGEERRGRSDRCGPTTSQSTRVRSCRRFLPCFYREAGNNILLRKVYEFLSDYTETLRCTLAGVGVPNPVSLQSHSLSHRR